MKKSIKVVALTLFLASGMLIAKKTFATGGGGGTTAAPGCAYTGLGSDACHFSYNGTNYAAVNCQNDDSAANCWFNPVN